jgi:hypothetical protein
MPIAPSSFLYLTRLYIQADTVYRLGNYEYSLQWRDAPESAQYAALRFGAWMLELKGHLQDKIDGKLKVRLYPSDPPYPLTRAIQIAEHEIHPQCQSHPPITHLLPHVLYRTDESRQPQIAHDGSIAPLLGFLQVTEMVWPGMGSEVHSSIHCFLPPFLTTTHTTRSCSSYTAVATARIRHTSCASSGAASRW